MPSVERAISEFNARAKSRGWVQLCDPSSGFVARECEELIAIWNEARRGNAMPARDDLNLKVLKPYLSRLVLVEREGEEPPRFRFRLVGTTVTQTLSERTGQTFDHESASSEQRERWTQSCQLTLFARRPLRFPIHSGRAVIGEMLTLPLADATGEPRFVLGYGRYEPTRNWSARAALAPAL